MKGRTGLVGLLVNGIRSELFIKFVVQFVTLPSLLCTDTVE